MSEMGDFLRAVRRAMPAFRRFRDEYRIPYEAERVVAHFEGRTPPSEEVFYEERLAGEPRIPGGETGG